MTIRVPVPDGGELRLGAVRLPAGRLGLCLPAPSPVAFAAVLRSWEERFGARLFAITHDQAYLLVERPPHDLDAALPVAAEHFVFCDEPAGADDRRGDHRRAPLVLLVGLTAAGVSPGT